MKRPLIIGAALLGIGLLSAAALLTVGNREGDLRSMEADIFVYGSGLGGTSAAITAAEQGAPVVLATESSVIGGQAVESGVSAFDDLRKSWEQWGLYLDLQNYLRKKYGGTDQDHAGLGEAVVGRVASPPADIESFFRERIAARQNITLLTGHSLLALRRKYWLWGPWNAADLLDIKTQQRTRVRFRYLVDGTTTGTILERTKTPYRLGFDAREETGERYALTAEQRWFFTDGMEWKEQRVGGLGNRIQAVTSPFVLLDQGFPGDFMPVGPPPPECLAPADSKGFIAGSSLFGIGPSPCTARVPLHPEFSDVYDLYLVYRGDGSVTSSVSSRRWLHHPITKTQTLSSANFFGYLGAFPASPEDGVSVAVSADSPSVLVEGVIMVKRNMPVNPLVTLSPLPERIVIDDLAASPALADVYVIGWGPDPRDALTVDGRTFPASLSGPQTLSVSSVPIRNGSILSLPASFRSRDCFVVILPKSPDLAALTFEGDAPEREIDAKDLEEDSTLVKTDLPIREWSFNAPADGDAFFLFQGDSAGWRLLELWSDDPLQRQEALSFVANGVTRNPRPLFSASLSGGKRYRLRIAVASGGSWDDFSWSIAFRPNAVLATARPGERVALSSGMYEGVYDIWAQAPSSSRMIVTVSHPESPDRSLTVTSARRQYEYLGKAFLDRFTSLAASQDVTSLVAIPNPNVDTYLRIFSDEAPQAAATFSRLPPGHYRTILTSTSATSLTVSASREGVSSTQALPFPAQKNPGTSRESAAILPHDGRSLTLSPLTGASSIRLFETIPSLQDAWTFTLGHHPLTGNSDVEPVPLFRFRNIVSPAALLARKIPLAPPNLGTNTAGVTLVINPSNDHAGVRTDEIDSRSLIESSRERSAAYAYWMRYDMPLTRQNLGCDSSSLPCTPKRTRTVFGLFADPLDMFPPFPYVRESRRLVSARTITQEDLLPTLASCNDGACPADCHPLAEDKNLCITESQEPLLFSDALAAAGYIADLHAFYSTQEYYPAVNEFLSAMREKSQQPNTPLLLPVWRMIYAKPTEVPLSALLAKDGGNVFPASNNIGVSQIANGLYRIHVNEMAIGQAVGSLLGACVAQRVEPSDFRGERLRALQHALVERGFVLYPVEDMMADDLLRAGVQHLIIEGLLTPAAVLPERAASPWGSVAYRITPDSPADQRDAAIIQALFPTDVQQPVTYHSLFLLLNSQAAQMTAEQLREFGETKGLLDEQSRTLSVNELPGTTPSKGDLYRAAAIALSGQWTNHY